MKSQRVVTENGKSVKRVLLIEEYFNTLTTDLSYKDFEEICKTPFRHFKKEIKEGTIYELRLKFLGKFKPMPSKIIWLLKKSKERFDKNLIEEKDHIETVNMLMDYIEKNPTEFTRFEEIIKLFK
jgi:hypothetical protein